MSGNLSLNVLDRVRIASPCSMRWEDLHDVGDGERVRHCDQCDLNVYNLSAMTTDDAEALLTAHEGQRICGGFYRRKDGTILTRDCPVGLALARVKLARVVARASAVLGLAISSAVLLGDLARGEPARLRKIDPFAKIVAWLNPAAPLPIIVPPSAPPTGSMTMTMGDMICMPPTPPTPIPLTGNQAPLQFLDLTGGQP